MKKLHQTTYIAPRTRVEDFQLDDLCQVSGSNGTGSGKDEGTENLVKHRDESSDGDWDGLW